MGKKGGWFSAIKRVFTHSSKDKPNTGSEKKSSKEKKRGKGILRYGESKSFIPLFREPSSIEKILEEADELFIRHPISSDPPKPTPSLLDRPLSPTRTGSRRLSPSSPKVTSPRVSSPKVVSPRPPSPKVAPPRAFTSNASSSKTTSATNATQSQKEGNHVRRPEPTLRSQHISATMIQAAFRGYLARRSFRALKGVVRLQGVVRGQNVKRQTANALKQMQLLVRVQTQIQSRRIQMLGNPQQAYRNDKEIESTITKWTQLSMGGQSDDWDDSVLTKEEVDARMRQKVEAVIKRERAMAYAYSQRLWKSNPKSAGHSPLDIRANGYPWWWNWVERQAQPNNSSATPPRPISEYRQSPKPHSSNHKNNNSFTFDNHESLTPRSSRSAIPAPAKRFHTPPTRTPLKDDDSLVSCPPFSVPNYMAPTVSAQAKVRAASNPKERSIPGTPNNDSKRRFSFPLTPNIGSFKWNKGSSNNDSTSRRLSMEKHLIGDLSVDSTVSMPVLVGRKPFNRFVRFS